MSKKILLVIFGIIFGLCLSEIPVRILRPQLTFSNLPNSGPNCYLSDPVLFIRFKPYSICHRKAVEFEVFAHINNLGFRGNNSIDIKNSQGERILFLGDSFTFGHGVEDNATYPERVGQILKNQGNMVEILNASLEGTEMTRDYIFLRENAPQLKPKVVIVGFFLGNDITDVSELITTGQDNLGLPEKIAWKDVYIDNLSGTVRLKATSSRYKIPLLRDSHLFILLSKLFFGNPIYYSGDLDQAGSPCLIKPACHSFDPQILAIKKVFLGMKKLSQDDNFKLVVIILPWEMQLPLNLQQRSGVFVPTNPQQRHFLSDEFAKFFNDNNITYVDTLNAFEKYSGVDQIFYPQDRHWTPGGHEIAAEALVPIIKNILK